MATNIAWDSIAGAMHNLNVARGYAENKSDGNEEENVPAIRLIPADENLYNPANSLIIGDTQHIELTYLDENHAVMNGWANDGNMIYFTTSPIIDDPNAELHIETIFDGMPCDGFDYSPIAYLDSESDHFIKDNKLIFFPFQPDRVHMPFYSMTITFTVNGVDTTFEIDMSNFELITANI